MKSNIKAGPLLLLNGDDWRDALDFRDMASRLTNLSVILSLGTGSGVPNSESGVRLGDVVVSCPTRRSSGVMRYDLADDNPFPSAPMSLQRAVESIRLSESTVPSFFHTYADHVAPAEEKWRRPHSKTDPSYDGTSPMVYRSRSSIEVHQGLIGSATAMMEVHGERDRLHRDQDIICFETDLANLNVSWPLLTIRGVSDYCDPHCARIWQPYAAFAAAAYAKLLIQHLDVEHSETGSHTEGGTLAAISTGRQKNDALVDMPGLESDSELLIDSSADFTKQQATEVKSMYSRRFSLPVAPLKEDDELARHAQQFYSSSGNEKPSFPGRVPSLRSAYSGRSYRTSRQSVDAGSGSSRGSGDEIQVQVKITQGGHTITKQKVVSAADLSINDGGELTYRDRSYHSPGARSSASVFSGLSNKAGGDAERRACHRSFLRTPYEHSKNQHTEWSGIGGEWLLRRNSFATWISASRSRMLLATHGAGTGKSMLARFLIDKELPRLAPDSAICYYFFSHRDQHNSVKFVLSAMLHQLFRHTPVLCDSALSAWKVSSPSAIDQPEVLWDIFSAVLTRPDCPPILCVLDGIDECSPAQSPSPIDELFDFLGHLDRMKDDGGATCSILLLCRLEPNILIRYNALAGADHLAWSISPGGSEDEVYAMTGTVSKLCNPMSIPLQDQTRLAEGISAVANFERPKVWIDFALNKVPSRSKVADALSGDQCRFFDEAFRCSVMNKAPQQRFEMIHTTLQILLAAGGSLTLGGLCVAMKIHTEPEVAKLHHCNPDGLSQLLRICRPFVVESEEEETVQFYHATMRAYLTDPHLKNSDLSRWYVDLGEIYKTGVFLLIKSMLLYDRKTNACAHFRAGFSKSIQKTLSEAGRDPLTQLQVAQELQREPEFFAGYWDGVVDTLTATIERQRRTSRAENNQSAAVTGKQGARTSGLSTEGWAVPRARPNALPPLNPSPNAPLSEELEDE
ncbi:hypothetical protein KVT40_007824 [Elsinoe batatas]|uniref:Nephrocystin 3-like N-terminal domain-containing protein n=1 Tax=Elsinoe batatas TaxID=2601811 RepID=A0A8K0KWS5_9PEZI|nr:hypothetical protein KVT40_007824 [Elsinoe batatas]